MRLFESLRRSGSPALCIAALMPGLTAQEVTPGPVVELPTYTVTVEPEMPTPETWYYTRIAGQEVLSSASPRRTEEMARNITQLVHALELTGTPLVPKPKIPLRIFIAGRPDQFLSLAPHALESGETDPESASLGGADSPVLVINAAAHSLDRKSVV